MTNQEAIDIIVDVLTEYGIKSTTKVKEEIADAIVQEFVDIDAISVEQDEPDPEEIDPDNLSEEDDILREL
jgi:hypothetical protein